MITIPNYQILTKIYESNNSVVYRGRRNEDNQPVILKALKEDYPTPEQLTHYRQEYDITDHLTDLDGVINVYCLEKHQNTLVMCVEDFGGESLKYWLTEYPFTLKKFLTIAIQITEILGQIHQHNIIHKDINPTNLIFNSDSGQLKIIDFGISTRLSREIPTLKNPNVLEGTLAYMSPEQTGRMNRAMDYRTDLYSLGVTFYELLTGGLPFDSQDSLELVHCHIAKTPTPVCEVNPDIPPIVSDIVMKLMAKNVEDRYQVAFGLKRDLEKCLDNLEGFENLRGFGFELAQHDFSGQFQIPQKLYGRDNESQTLLDAFERVSKGTTEMILVAGYSGVGKSALVHEVHKPITSKHAYFAAGKFDQYQRNIPYSALTHAFNEFCHYLLTESTEQLTQWQEIILNAVSNNGQVLIDVVPDLELVIGKQPTIAQVGSQEAQNRFNFVFQNFMHAICQPNHPLVLFIDDWQWADSASLILLNNLMTAPDNQYLLVIGAYRDNEVDASHPFMMMVEELKNANVTVNQIELSNLSYDHVNLLISEALGCEQNHAHALTNLVYDKTHGNAFFTTEFLKSLYDEELLVFDFEEGQQWQWEVDKIAAKGMTDNVVELMAGKIGKLATDIQTALTLAACIGNTFDLKMLSIIGQQQPFDTLTQVLKAIEEGLLLPLDDHYKLLENIESGEAEPRFKFQHDRVQQAAYSLIANTDKQAIHLRIGRLLLANTPPAELEDSRFDIVYQLNEGSPLLDNQAEQRQLTELNLQAGQKAKHATAYAAAQQYLEAGIALLGKDSWQRDYPLTFALHKEQAEVMYLNGNFEDAEKLIHATLAQAQSVLEQAELYYLLITQYIQIAQYKQAISIGRSALALLGINLPETEKELQTAADLELAEIKKNLADKEITSLLEHPATNNPEPQLIINVLWKLTEAAYGTGAETLLSSIFTKSASIGLKYHVPESSLSYMSYAYLLSFYEEYQSAYEFGLLGLKLSENTDNVAHKCIAYEGLVDALMYWVKPLKDTDTFFQKGYQTGLESGTFSQTGYLLCHYPLLLFYRGENLEKIIEKVSQFVPFAKKTNHGMLLGSLSAITLALWNLSGRTTEKGLFHNEELDEAQYLADSGKDDGIQICFFQILKSQVLYLYDKPDEALQCSLEAEKLLGYIAGMYPTTEYNFYYSLNLAALYPTASEEKQQQYRQQLETNQTQMKNWADNCPENFLHKYLLVEAEMARISGKALEAMDLYDHAIASARDNEFIQNEALGHELLAKFWFSQNKEEYAQIHLKKAHYGYQLWGAKRKVGDLEERYPKFLAPKTSQSGVTMIGMATSRSLSSLVTPIQQTPSTFLDLNSVIKASQTLSGEIMLGCLLEQMMQIVIENAGAEKGFLLLQQQDKWFIEAEGHVDKVDITDVTVLQSTLVENHQQVAETIIHYVARTFESVVLDNATCDGNFIRDPYIIKQQPKSVLCAPLLKQGELTGLLYLENNLTESAFTPDRLEVLKVLSSQIAISIENALLYQTLEQKVEERTVQLASANQEITTLNEQLKSDNLRMGAELDVSRRLQQMLLPSEKELSKIKELDIAGFMEPADEVGGDFYDVLQQNGRIICSIGDVTGHGLESGVLAIMVQSVVRALTTHNETDPVKFLSTLNRMIYDNVLRMNSDKTLTLALLSYQDGLVHLSGQHEEMIVVREGHLERVDTIDLGFPIGLEKDIVDFVAQTSVSLIAGDVVVLYTDGITEAENLAGKFYGIERLCEVIRHNWQQSAHDIRQTVVDDVRQFIGKQKVFDDITLLVLKQK